MMESGSPPLASSPPKADDAKVSSHRYSPSLEETWGDLTVPEGNRSAAGGTGRAVLMETGDEGPGQFIPQPQTIPETNTAQKSSE